MKEKHVWLFSFCLAAFAWIVLAASPGGNTAQGASADLALGVTPSPDPVGVGTESLYTFVVTNLVTTTTAVSPSADLDLTGSVEPVTGMVGSPLSYRCTVQNLGPNLATGVVLSNPLPPSAILTSVVVTNGAWTNSQGTLLCQLDDLPVSAAATVIWAITPMSVQPLTNVAVVYFAGSMSDPDPGNNHWWNVAEVVPVAPVADMKLARAQHVSTLLDDGRVLITGGVSPGVTATAEVYDPVTETFNWTGNMTQPRYRHTATLLPNGQVLVAGGYTGTEAVSAVEFYDPTGGVFAATMPLSGPRHGHTATLLADGRVVIAGSDTRTLTGIEIYDCRTATVAPGGNLLTPRGGHTATLLPNGQILFAGGSTVDPKSVELYDPETQTSTAGGHLNSLTDWFSAVLLFDGRVLLVGDSTAELYDPVSQIFSNTASLLVIGRHLPCVTLLANGQVMVSGGTAVAYNFPVEFYDPVAGLFAARAPMTQERRQHSAVLLRDGRVLITGGNGGIAASEIYAVFEDADLDGMDDAWERSNGLNPADRGDAIQDADRDGLTNLQEYLAGTNPHDPASVMRISTVQVSADSARISFNSIPAKRYRVQRTADVQGGSWATVAENVVGTGGILKVMDLTAPGQTKQLYRVQLLP